MLPVLKMPSSYGDNTQKLTVAFAAIHKNVKLESFTGTHQNLKFSPFNSELEFAAIHQNVKL